MSEEKVLKVESGPAQRLDVFLTGKSPDLSRSKIKRMILMGDVLVNGKAVKPHYMVQLDDEIRMQAPQFEAPRQDEEDIPLSILFEDEDIIAVDKAAGMVVHPGNGNYQHTLVNALLYYTRRQLSQVGGEVRPGIVHRLDKNTSGVLLVAKHDRAHRRLAEQFRSHKIHKVYYAFVKGVVQHDELKCSEAVSRSFMNRKKIVVSPASGKEAVTFFKVKERFAAASWVEARPVTGRTHQLRVHLAFIGHPLLGDDLYGVKSILINRHALHAYSIAFRHPMKGTDMHIISELPADMQALAERLRV